jgi:hypothetical protein
VSGLVRLGATLIVEREVLALTILALRSATVELLGEPESPLQCLCDLTVKLYLAEEIDRSLNLYVGTRLSL